VGSGNFARRPSETRSYSVEPAISADADPRYWVDAHLLNIASSQIQELDVKPAGGPAYALHRPKPADAATKPVAAGAGGAPTGGVPSGSAASASGTSTPAPVDDAITLDGVPAGRKALESAALAASTNTLSSLNADDVAPAGSIDFGQSSQVIVTLTDGGVVTLTGTVVGDKHWVQVTSTKDAALTAKTSGRAFDIAPYRYDGIFKPLDQLLVPKESPGSKPPAAIKTPTSPQSPSSSKLPPHPPKGLASPTTP
jgi:hypothetical protein